MELVQSHYQNGLRAMNEALTVLSDASRAPKKAPPQSSSPPLSPSPPVVGRAIISAIKACSQSSYGAHLAAAALERGLAESELRHSQGNEFLLTNLIQPIQDRVGGPVAAAVAKCCLLGVGPLPLYELGSGGSGGGSGGGSQRGDRRDRREGRGGPGKKARLEAQGVVLSCGAAAKKEKKLEERRSSGGSPCCF
jgi:hypothetical protein